jgi:hypothetical protein
LLSKSDVGISIDPAAGQPLPHAGASRGTISTTFTDVANGNQTSEPGRAFPRSICRPPLLSGLKQRTFSHGPDHQQFKQVAPEATPFYAGAFGIHAKLLCPTSQRNDDINSGEGMLGVHVLYVDNSVTVRSSIPTNQSGCRPSRCAHARQIVTTSVAHASASQLPRTMFEGTHPGE